MRMAQFLDRTGPLLDFSFTDAGLEALGIVFRAWRSR